MRAVREVGVHCDPDESSQRVTSLTVGEEVFVVAGQGEWTRVLAPDQPTWLDPAGYPGWVRTDALAEDDPLAVARGFLGTPYVWGGLGRDGIDCSGLVHLSFRAIGVRVPRDAADQAAAAVPVEVPQPGRPLLLRPGGRGGQPRRVRHRGRPPARDRRRGRRRGADAPKPAAPPCSVPDGCRDDGRHRRRVASRATTSATSTRRSGWSSASCRSCPTCPRSLAAGRPRP